MEVVPKPSGEECTGQDNTDNAPNRAEPAFVLELTSSGVTEVKPHQNLLEVTLANGIPYPVMKLIQHLEDNDTFFVENLYGITGKFLFKLEGSFIMPNTLHRELKLASYHTMATFILRFLRVHVGPLLPTIYFDQLLELGTKANAGKTEEVMAGLKRIITSLEVKQLNLLGFVSCHLRRIAHRARYNNMDAKELSKIFVPVYACRKPKIPYCKTKLESEEEMTLAPVVEILISQAFEMFKGPFKAPDFENFTSLEASCSVSRV